MLFKLYTYVHPTHYFGLRRKDGTWPFPKVTHLPETILAQASSNISYLSKDAETVALSWYALKYGYIGDAPNYKVFEEVPLSDSYRFLRSIVHPVWVVYVLLFRLLSLKPPIKELKAFFSSNNVKRQVGFPIKTYQNSYDRFTSELIMERPLVSIIIPTLNRYPYLKDVLHDLEGQDYNNFEIIIVDQSEPYQPEFYENFELDITLIHRAEKALWKARNTAIRKAKGVYLLFFDDDSRVAKDWVSEHLKTLDYFNADISSGVSLSKVGDRVPAHYSYFKISEQLDTGNAMIKRKVFEQIGLFDRQFEKMRMGDGEFGCRAYIEGLKNVSNPKAKRLHLKVGQGGLRAMGSWDAFRTKYLWQPRPIPSVLYYFRRYYGAKRSLLAILKTVPLAIMPYRYKGHSIATALGLLLLVFIWPIILFQVLRSWHIASKMIAEGPKIERL